MARLKTASYAVHADPRQAVRWRRASDGEGYRSVGEWLAVAADRHLQAVARSGRPVLLAWRLGSFSVYLDGGELARVKGHLSPPFGCFAGTDKGPTSYYGGRRHVLVFLTRPGRSLRSEASGSARRWHQRSPRPSSAASCRTLPLSSSPTCRRLRAGSFGGRPVLPWGMRDRTSKHPKRPRDLNQLAYQIVQEATGEAPI